MADGAATGATTTTTDAGNGAAANGSATAATKTFTQDQVNDLVAREKGQVERRFADYDDLKSKASKLDEITNANKSDLEKVAGDRDTFKGRAETAEAKLARFEAAAKAELPLEHAGRIQGSTPEEMEADAKKLAESLGGTTRTDFDQGARKPAPAGGDMNSFIRSGSRKATG